MRYKELGWVPLMVSCAPLLVQAAAGPQLMQAQQLLPGTTLETAGYLVSEKLDGVRAYWNGNRLMTRHGLSIDAPAWFTSALPPTPLDGELWIGRGQFQEISNLVRNGKPDDSAWHQVSYQLFDLPEYPETFAERSRALRTLIQQLAQPHIVWIEQRPIESRAALDQQLSELTANGGEGLVLHHRSAHYLPERNPLLLKYKGYQDAEATVIGYTDGEGKYAGQVGALIVRIEDGTQLRLGSGLSDADRASPPPLGSQVTYRYNGLTAQGIPRFARFMRRYDPAL